MIPAVILAGGRGARMGGNKPFHSFGGSTLVETVIARLRPQTPAVFINAGRVVHPLARQLEALGLPMAYDDPMLSGLGPLSGVLSALDLARDHGWRVIATVPCDMPRLPMDMLARLENAPAAPVVYYQGERDYPLCALWSTDLFEPLQDALTAARAQGGLAVRRFLATAGATTLTVRDDDAFININDAVA